eukprot:scaffold37590_cov155-Skeletonema_dohrnii-CCMP3373.AAC.5
MISYASTFFFLLLACSSTTSINAWSSSSVLPIHCNWDGCRSISTKLSAAATAHQEENTNNTNNNNSGGSTAIILNLNARSVSGSSKELISLASSIVGEKHVYVTRTIEDALLAARMVVRQGRTCSDDETSDDGLLPYSLVVPVGGDGTLSGWIDGMVNEIMLLDTDTHDKHPTDDDNYHQLKVHEAVGRLPTVGYIPMGTGNGLGYVIGCRMPKSKSKFSSAAESGDDDKKKKKKWRDKLKSKLSLKRRKVEHAGRVMSSLKQIGDELQQQQGQQQQQQQHHQQNREQGEYSVVEMPLMEVTHHSPDEQNITKGDLCFFAGSGFDSLMLEDFKQVKAWSKSPQRSWTPSFVKDMLSSVAGYCVALVTKTLPQALLHQTHKISVKVTTTDEGTLWIDHRRGDFSELAVDGGGGGLSVKEEEGMEKEGEEELDSNNDGVTTKKKKKKKRQHLIYSGITGILAASTTPFYGGGMRLFPYARLFPNKLQLRIGRISPLTGFLRIPAIFEGSYRDKSEGDFGCLDFVGDDFEVEVSSTRYEEYLKRKKEQKESKKKARWWRRKKRSDDDASDETSKSSSPTGFPFQHSGESMGIKERFRVRVVKQPVRFISFLKPRIVVDD